MTAAHCVVKTFTYNKTTIEINTNNFYPTFESMFTVYAGINDISFLTNGNHYFIPNSCYKIIFLRTKTK